MDTDDDFQTMEKIVYVVVICRDRSNLWDQCFRWDSYRRNPLQYQWEIAQSHLSTRQLDVLVDQTVQYTMECLPYRWVSGYEYYNYSEYYVSKEMDCESQM